MPWHAIYRAATGRLVSVGSVIAKTDAQLGAEGLARKEFAGRPDRDGMWDEAMRDFVPRPVKKAVLRKDEFWDRFTDAEQIEVFNAPSRVAAAQKDRAQATLEYLRNLSEADLNNPRIGVIVARFETLGLIGAGRAAEILS